MKELGADHTLDYNDPNVIENLKALGPIKFGLDTIANTTTFQGLYDATAGTPEVYLDSLLGLDGKSIKTDPSRENSVHWGYTLAYLCVIKEKSLGPTKFVQTPELVDDYLKWWNEVLPTFIGKIKHANLKILGDGLASANEALQLSRDSKVSAQKIVFTV